MRPRLRARSVRERMEQESPVTCNGASQNDINSHRPPTFLTPSSVCRPTLSPPTAVSWPRAWSTECTRARCTDWHTEHAPRSPSVRNARRARGRTDARADCACARNCVGTHDGTYARTHVRTYAHERMKDASSMRDALRASRLSRLTATQKNAFGMYVRILRRRNVDPG